MPHPESRPSGPPDSRDLLSTTSFDRVLASAQSDARRDAREISLCIVEDAGERRKGPRTHIQRLLNALGRRESIGWLDDERLGILVEGPRTEAVGVLDHLRRLNEELGGPSLSGRITEVAPRAAAAATPPASAERSWSLPMSW